MYRSCSTFARMEAHATDRYVPSARGAHVYGITALRHTSGRNRSPSTMRWSGSMRDSVANFITASRIASCDATRMLRSSTNASPRWHTAQARACSRMNMAARSRCFALIVLLSRITMPFGKGEGGGASPHSTAPAYTRPKRQPRATSSTPTSATLPSRATSRRGGRGTLILTPSSFTRAPLVSITAVYRTALPLYSFNYVPKKCRSSSLLSRTCTFAEVCTCAQVLPIWAWMKNDFLPNM